MTDSDERDSAESEAAEAQTVQESDWTPLQFNIRHVIVLTAVLGLAFGIYRFDLSGAEIKLLCGFGVLVTAAVLLPVMIFWLFRSN